jgi:hypothetical protein
MMLPTTRRGLAAAGVIAAGLFLAQCAGSSLIAPSPNGSQTNIRLEGAEKVTTQATTGLVQSSQAAYESAVTGGAKSAGLLGGAAVSVVSGGSCSTTSVKYYNAQGQEQSAYDPTKTTRAKVTGNCAWSGNSASYDVTLDDMLASSTSYLVNGTTQGTYDGSAASGTLTNVRIPKTGCQYPTSGTGTITTNGTTFNVKFDGSPSITGTYVVDGKTITITIPLPLTGC